jgi:hypothetical protein
VRVECVRKDQVVAETLGPALGQVAETTEQALRRLTQEISAFQELEDEMGNLQQEASVLDLPGAACCRPAPDRTRRSSGS